MPFALLAALALVAFPVAAQTPDSTPPEAYFPLGTGDVWQFVDTTPGVEIPYFEQVVLQNTVVSDTLYALVETRSFRPDFSFVGAAQQLVRFDAAAARVGVRFDSRDTLVAPARCRLDAPFPTGAAPVPCAGPQAVVASGGPDEPVTIGAQTVTTAVKVFESPEGRQGFAAGIGQIFFAGAGDAFPTELRFARVGGVTYGAPVVDGEAAPEAAALALAAAPNPTAGPLALTVTLPAPAALAVEAFDALGRRVHRAEATVGAGAHRLAVDASGWAPGVYVVRVAADTGEAASLRVVRR